MFPLQKNIIKNELPQCSKYFLPKNLNINAIPKQNIENTLSKTFKLKLNTTDTGLKTYSSNKYLKKNSEGREDGLSKLGSKFEYNTFVNSIFSNKKTKFLNETLSNIKTPFNHFPLDESKIKMKTEEKIRIINTSDAFKSPINVKNQPKVYFGDFKDIMNKKRRSLHVNSKRTDTLQNSDCSLEDIMGSNEEKAQEGK